MYAHGQGVPQIISKRRFLMRKAAENMYYPAQLYLGVAYFMVKACLRGLSSGSLLV